MNRKKEIKTYKTINQSPVVAPVEAWVKCSKDLSSRILTELSHQQNWHTTSWSNVQSLMKLTMSAMFEKWNGFDREQQLEIGW